MEYMLFVGGIFAFIILIVFGKSKNNNRSKSQNFKKGLNMSKLTATEIGKNFSKTGKEINNIFSDLDWIEKCNQGWKLTSAGKEKGGVQNNYKGSLSVKWDKKILENKTLINIIKEDKSEDKEETNFRDKFKAEYRANTGHFVRSRAEVIIANWLYSECIAFAYEKRVPIEEEMYCDFFIPKEKIYIEFWGYEENDKYIQRKNKKLELYKKYNFKLIEIDNNTINNIDDFLPKELIKFGMSM